MLVVVGSKRKEIARNNRPRVRGRKGEVHKHSWESLLPQCYCPVAEPLIALVES